MQEETKQTPMVDIDTSGPNAEVELKDEAQTEEQVETKEQDTSPEPQEASSEEQVTDDQKESKDKELENYSKDVQRRIAKLTGKWREAQRQRDEAIEFAKVQKEKADSLNKKYSSLETSSMKDRQSKIQSLLDAQKAKLAQAREAGDVNAEVDIQKEISRLGYEEVRLQELSQIAEEQKAVKEETVTPTYQPRQPEPVREVDPKAESWASNNRWFGTDKAMTYTAFDLHKTLVDEEGYDPKSDEYYVEIDKRMRVEFPHKFDTNNDTNIKGESTKPTQTVASATRSVKQSRKTISLTPSEVAIAKKLGVSLEDYAKQKKYMKEV
tara:strand:- start:1151 stop:2122 length:972 start_codon:yes stop_codon:yes gene_type:complete